MTGPVLAPEDLRLFAGSENPACVYVDFVAATHNEYVFSRDYGAYASIPASVIATLFEILETEWRRSLHGLG
jgi:hypothetical protein